MPKLHIEYIPDNNDSDDRPLAFIPSLEQIQVRREQCQEVGRVAATFVEDEPPLPPAEIKRLKSNECVRLNLDLPICSSSHEICENPPAALDGPVVAKIMASRKAFYLVDTRANHRRNLTSRNFALINTDDMDSIRDDTSGIQGLPYNQPIIIGRKHLSDSFSYPKTVSDNHFELLYDKRGVQLINLQPHSTTTVIGHFEPTNQVEYGVI